MNSKELNKILKDHHNWLNENGNRADLRGVDLSGVNLRGVNLRLGNLNRADLRWADLRWANLSWADLSGANLSGADLRWADLSGANLSGCKGILSQSSWMSDVFNSDKKGILVYKAIGNTAYEIPKRWKIKENSTIEEVCNPNRTNDCGCGVNFGTLEWIKNNYKKSDIWLCRIEWKDLPGVVVPYNTDGKARCERLTLLHKEK